jgi:ribosome-associated heat shock protein Hsp15
MSDEGLRADKWLWYARFFKTRSIATKACNAGQVRIGGNGVSKAHSKVKIGDVLTFPQGRHIRVVKVLALAGRRGPAPEARKLYKDLKPPEVANRLPRSAAQGRAAGAGRPTKKDRRAMERLIGQGYTKGH